jgi:hypothetical protein
VLLLQALLKGIHLVMVLLLSAGIAGDLEILLVSSF